MAELVPSPSPTGTIPLVTAEPPETPESRGVPGAIERSYGELARGEAELGAGAENLAKPLAEAKAAEDLQNQKVVTGPDGKIQVLNPARSLIFGPAGEAYGHAVVAGTASQIETNVDQQLADIHLKHLGDPQGQSQANQAFLAGLKGATGNPLIDELVNQRATEEASRHYVSNLESTTRINLDNQKTGLTASITSLQEDLATMARKGAGAGNPDYDKAMAELNRKWDEKQSNPLMKDPPELVELQKKQFDLRLMGENLNGALPDLIDREGMNAARQKVHDMLDNAALEPSTRSRLKFEANQILADATPKWRSENRAFDVTAENLMKDFNAHKGTGPQGVSAWGTTAEGQTWGQQLIEAMRLGRERGYEREPELEALAASAPWLKSMGQLSPDQRNALATPYTPAAVEPGAAPAAGGAFNPAEIRDISGSSTYRGGQLGEIKGFIWHHTGGGGTVEGVGDTLNSRGLGSQYIMDRDGTIYRFLPQGARGAHILNSEINDLSNANTEGMEVIAKDDKDITPAQVASARRFAQWYSGQHPGVEYFGHGQVNPGHKEADEGRTLTLASREAAGGGATVQPASLTVGGPATAAAMPPEAQRVVGGLGSRGLDAMHSAVLAGNIQQESNFNAGSRNEKEGGIGLLSWRLDRRDALESFARSRGSSPGDHETQMDFLMNEIRSTPAGRAFLEAKTPEEANAALHKFIGYGDNTEPVRLANAAAILSGKGGGGGAPDALGGFSHEQIRQNPWLLAVQTMGMNQDPAEKMGYFDALLKTNTELMKLGQLPNPTQWAEIERIHSDNAGDARYESKYAEAAGWFGAVSAEGMPAAQRTQFDNQVNQAAANLGGDPWTRAIAVAAQNHVSELDKNWVEHPLEMAARTGMVSRPAAPLDFGDPQTATRALAERGAIADTVAARRNVPVSGLEGSDLQTAQDILKAGTPQQKMMLLDGMSQWSGPTLNATLGRLGRDPQGGAYIVAAGLLAQSQPQAAQDVIEGQEILAKEPRFAPVLKGKGGFDESLASALPPSSLPNPDQRAAIGAAARAVYAGLSAQANDTSGTMNPDRFDQALKTVTGGVLDFRGAKILAPVYNGDADALDRMLRQVGDADLSQARAPNGETVPANILNTGAGWKPGWMERWSGDWRLESRPGQNGQYYVFSGDDANRQYLRDAGRGSKFILDLTQKR
jgi:hypothetical protein